ncbi:T9SS type B sorting domain-containing protein [Bizionia sp. KMM 8389]
MKNLSLYIFLLVFSTAFAQEQASNWYFGENAGIQFQPDGSVVALDDGQLNTVEGCSSISDSNGDLLFYTEGSTVYTKNHTIMSNGMGLLGNLSSTQSAIVVPKPEDADIYYIFTVGSNQSLTGLNYSVVDMTLDSGLGAVTIKNQRLLNQCAEKIAAVLRDCATGAIWVIALSNANGSGTFPLNTFHAFEVTTAGVNNTAVTTSFSSLTSNNDMRGYLKFSPDGSKVACAYTAEGIYLFDFDVNTGIFTNDRQLSIPSVNDSPYGAEFSPNSNILYVTASNDYFGTGADTSPSRHQSVLVQYDLTALNISTSAVILDNRTLYRSALQLGPNGKIYRTMAETYTRGLPSLSVINSPNSVGTAADYVHNAVSLGQNNSTQGLPPFIASFFVEKIDIIGNASSEGQNTFLPLCTGDIYTLTADDIPGATYTWTKDDAPLAESDFDLEVDEAGVYKVVIDLNNGDCNRIEGEAVVEYFDIPVANPISKLDICDTSTTSEFDLTVRDIEILGTQDPANYNVSYFENTTDANNNENAIVGLYTNTSNPQTIVARIDNKGNANCYETTTFEIQVYITPVVSAIDDQVWCDDAVDGDDANGQVTINLLDFDAIALGTQNPADFDVSYYTSQNNADLGISPLPNDYYNQTAFQELIFVRVENNQNTDCYSTDSFTVNINPVPEAFNSSLIQCDVDGNSDGITTFNLEEAYDTISGSSATVSVEYYENAADAMSSSDEIDAASYTNTSNPEVLIAKVIDNTTGCYKLADLTLEVSTTQINNYDAPVACDELGSEDGINTFDLTEFTTAIQQDNGITFPVSYYETYNDALLETNALTSPYTNTTPYNQTLYARVENNNACFGIASVNITINSRPTLEADETLLYCLNTYPQSIFIDAGVLNDSPNNYTYSWSSGQTTNQIAVNEVGNYTVTVTNSAGCEQTRTVNVEASNIATILALDVSDGLQGNNSVTVIVSGEGEYEYALFDDSGNLYANYQTNPEFTNVKPGIYTVMVKDVKNDCGTVDAVVSVIGFPKVFTPNGDGMNDTWNVYGVSAQIQPNTRILIFDRYGKLLKQLSPLDRGWDGTYKGETLPVDDYWFSVQLQDGRVFKSHFTLKR